MYLAEPRIVVSYVYLDGEAFAVCLNPASQDRARILSERLTDREAWIRAR